MLIDTHCHLDDEVFLEDAEQVAAAARTSGVEIMLTQGTSIASSLDCITLAEKCPGVFAAVAIHPNCLMDEIPKFGSEDVFYDIFTQMAQNPRVRAIGETGLDLYWDDTPLEIQKRYLRHHFELARRTHLPVVIHCRDAEEAFLEVAQKDFAEKGAVPGVIHSFSGDSDFLKECLQMGFYISYSGSVTFTNKKLDALRATVPLVPSDRVMVETDSPYLAPVPFRGKVKRNTPSLVVHTAESIAKLREISEEELARITTENACRLFRF